ncbi:MAG TPA: thermonuclease family protein [Planctomycetota bacterium]|nr:thermonuclease family protein [Planctomycetota bacterium]
MKRRSKQHWFWIAAGIAAVALIPLLRNGWIAGRIARVADSVLAGDDRPTQAVGGSVADGDTFSTLDGEAVRLLGIDAPEHGELFSQQAKRRLRELVVGREVDLVYDVEKTDRYGRLLCHVHADGLWVNKALVSEGLANVYIVRPNLDKTAELVSAQKAARTRKAGIWSVPPPSPEPYYLRSKNSFRFHRPSCKLAREISPKNAVKLTNREAALDAGLSSCRTCRP